MELCLTAKPEKIATFIVGDSIEHDPHLRGGTDRNIYGARGE